LTRYLRTQKNKQLFTVTDWRLVLTNNTPDIISEIKPELDLKFVFCCKIKGKIIEVEMVIDNKERRFLYDVLEQMISQETSQGLG
jgi:hypothetical protein